MLPYITRTRNELVLGGGAVGFVINMSNKREHYIIHSLVDFYAVCNVKTELYCVHASYIHAHNAPCVALEFLNVYVYDYVRRP